MNMWKRFIAWWKQFTEMLRVLMYLHPDALADPAWLTHQQLQKETKQMWVDAMRHAGLSAKVDETRRFVYVSAETFSAENGDAELTQMLIEMGVTRQNELDAVKKAVEKHMETHPMRFCVQLQYFRPYISFEHQDNQNVHSTFILGGEVMYDDPGPEAFNDLIVVLTPGQ